MAKAKLIVAALAGVGIMTAGAAGIASAQTPPKTGNVGSSGIPKSVFREERQDAVAQVLNTTTSNVQTARKGRTFSQLLSKAGLSEKTFHQKLKVQLTSDLESKGYSQDQITIALQQRTIHYLRHHKSHNV